MGSTSAGWPLSLSTSGSVSSSTSLSAVSQAQAGAGAICAGSIARDRKSQPPPPPTSSDSAAVAATLALREGLALRSTENPQCGQLAACSETASLHSEQTRSAIEHL